MPGKTILLVLISLYLLGQASGEEINGKALLIKGKKELDAGRYIEAAESLSAAYEGLPVVGDYILFWLARAQREMSNYAESNSRINELVKHFPDSPLKKKALSMKIKNIIYSKEMLQDFQIFGSYVKDYPEDCEIKLLFAQLLKNKGETEKAKKMFKDIYIRSEGMFSKMAYNELTPSDITLNDLIEKSQNLMDAMEFKKAETILRAAVLKDDGRQKAEILKKLGNSVFRQRRYKEAAELYEKAGDHYSMAKAIYRAGEKSTFDDVLKKLASMGDRRIGSLLILAASDKRRNGEIAEALSIYKNVTTNYPSEAEDSLWGTGWTYYRGGEYQKAHDIFSDLYSIYGRSKYLYWKARSLERSGKDAAYIYRQLTEKEDDFYSLLARIKMSQESEKESRGHGDKDSSQILKTKNFERVDILMELGMTREAIAELSAAARKAAGFEELAYICYRLQEAGEYGLAITLASKLPYGKVTHGILYPLAYWSVVREAASGHGVDPLIVLSVMREESRFDPKARSTAGALGLMQLMPQTAYLLDKKINMNITSWEQIHDIKINITLGSYYLNFLIKEFASYPVAIAAYNAGEDIVRKWQRSGNYKSSDEFIEDIPYDETRNFAKRVIKTYFEYLESSGEKDTPGILQFVSASLD
ncbi:MAG: transglycosylase SLT domain-containing protein [Nitrospirae bacterium]|nr:transglycosylase SLT domain-containing protein [Nitrospirota bacterium]